MKNNITKIYKNGVNIMCEHIIGIIDGGEYEGLIFATETILKERRKKEFELIDNIKNNPLYKDTNGAWLKAVIAHVNIVKMSELPELDMCFDYCPKCGEKIEWDNLTLK